MAKREKTDVPGVFKRTESTGKTTYLALWRDAAGDQHEKLGFATKGDARRAKHRFESDKAQGLTPADEKQTFCAWAERWFKAHSVKIAPATVAQYESLLRRHVLPVLGDRRLATLRPIDIEEFVDTLTTKGLGPSGVSTSKKLVHQILAAAVKNNLMLSNPAVGVRVARSARTEKRALAAAQVEHLVSAVPKAYRVLVLTLAYGGLRPAEAAALQRQDFVGGGLRVRATLSEVRGHLERRECTKTYAPRTVELAGSVLDELDRHIRETVPWRPEAPIFTGTEGGPLRVSIFRRSLREAVRKAGLPEWVTPYTLRHTCASQLARQGVPVHVAARFMGHDPAEYLRTYAHLYDGDLEGAAKALDGARQHALAPVIEIDALRRPS